MSIHSKTLCLALALGLGTAAIAQDTPQADREQLRKELSEAQRQLADVSKRVAELSMQIGGDPARVQMFRYLGNPDRAVIGVILAEGGKDGVPVEGVTPGGPADKAGLRAGDLITAVRGASLAGERPQQALREALKDMKEGDKVTLGYRRDGRSYTAELTAARQASVTMLGGPGANAFWFSRDDLPAMAPLPDGFDQRIEAIVERAVDEGDGIHVNVMSMVGMGGLRLSSVNEGLGRYFGVNEDRKSVV